MLSVTVGARRLFAESVAGLPTSFEGGPIGYNIPYCRDVPLAESLVAWEEVDDLVGVLASDGIVVEREMFGSLTGVLVPPSIALSCVLLEAMLACRRGCTCASLALPQGGHLPQDVPMLRAARSLATRYLPSKGESLVGVARPHADYARVETTCQVSLPDL